MKEKTLADFKTQWKDLKDSGRPRDILEDSEKLRKLRNDFVKGPLP